MTSTLNPTLLKINLMKRTFSIVPRKLKNTLKETKQTIRYIRGYKTKKTNKRKKICVEILSDSMLNGIQEKELNKNASWCIIDRFDRFII